MTFLLIVLYLIVVTSVGYLVHKDEKELDA